MWELLENGPFETWRAKAEGGYLYRVDGYQQDENGDWILKTSTMVFVP